MILEFVDNQNQIADWPVGELAELLCDHAIFSDSPREFFIRQGSEPDSLLFDYGMGNASGGVLARGSVPAGASVVECENTIRRVVNSVSR